MEKTEMNPFLAELIFKRKNMLVTKYIWDSMEGIYKDLEEQLKDENLTLTFPFMIDDVPFVSRYHVRKYIDILKGFGVLINVVFVPPDRKTRFVIDVRKFRELFKPHIDNVKERLKNLGFENSIPSSSKTVEVEKTPVTSE